MTTQTDILLSMVNAVAVAERQRATLEAQLRTARRERADAVRAAREEREARLAVIAAARARLDRDGMTSLPDAPDDEADEDDGMGEVWWGAGRPTTGPLAAYGRDRPRRTRALRPGEL